MSVADRPLVVPGGSQAAEYPAHHYLNHTKGFLSWAMTLDHKRIGVMYMVGVLASFALGGMFALMIRIHLWNFKDGWLSNQTYNQVFTLHGAIMVFLFIIPSIPAALGNFLLPIMLGTKDVAFPRLNLMSFYLWVSGLVLFLLALSVTGLDTGWTFYTPYSIETQKGGAVLAATMGVFVLGFSSIFTGLNFIVTINTMRPPGMTWFRMPLFLWATYATAIIQVLATPVLGITVLLLAAERVLGIGIFDPKLNGDPVTFQHFFWFYSHPAVYIMILPAMGIISELMSVHCHKGIFGYRMIAYSSIAIALFGFLVWGHHMFTSGMADVTTIVFSALTFTVSIPSAIKVFNWLGTMYQGTVSLNTPMLYALAFIFLFTIGGLTGLPLGALSTDMHLHDTYFVVAHFHYVMMGGTLVAFLGGLFHWWPKMTGKMFNDGVGMISAAIVFVGFNLTFLPQFVLGTRGMPRRYATYVEEFQDLHRLSTIGSLILGFGLVVAGLVLLHSLFYGKRAPKNPWGGATLEWECSSPPPHDNFASAPTVDDPYNFAGIDYDPKTGGYVKTA
ncbi:MAG: cbb3-type cytochrome c oxidase subunit I [Planctomycetota bacterium]|jgi:cytochrome c oxidase subunit 1